MVQCLSDSVVWNNPPNERIQCSRKSSGVFQINSNTSKECMEPQNRWKKKRILDIGVEAHMEDIPWFHTIYTIPILF